MKKTILSILTLLAISTGVNAQNVNIPDANFKAYLVGNAAINTNGDTEIQVTEANAFSSNIDCPNLSISDLTGVESFTALSQLDCSNNQLTSLDVSSNTALGYLDCDNNQLTSLNVSSNTTLVSLRCYINQLTSLDVSQNTILTSLYCGDNQLSNLDVSSNTNLTRLYCGDSQLSSLNLANGNNSNFIGFYAVNNSNLTCIQVDDATWSATNWTNIDAAASFSVNCGSVPCTVDIPDANFKTYLVGNTAINTNGNAEIECSEASSFTGAINCTNQNISDLTGIEAFTALDQLFCSSNGLSSINVTANTLLTRLDFTNNNLSTIDLSANQLIKKINCQSNLLQSIDLTTNVDLEQLDIRNNPITTLAIDNNTALVDLNCRSTSISVLNTASNINLAYIVCDQNSINSLDFSTNVNLLEVFCNDNALTSLNLANGNNTSINFVDFINNPNLTCIQVDDVTYSTSNWTSIDSQTSFNTNCSGGSTGVNEETRLVLNVYPNPAQNQLFIELEDKQVTEIVILDYSGRIVRSLSQNIKSIDVSGLNKGIYILKASTSNGMYMSQFIKQ